MGSLQNNKVFTKMVDRTRGVFSLLSERLAMSEKKRKLEELEPSDGFSDEFDFFEDKNLQGDSEDQSEPYEIMVHYPRAVLLTQILDDVSQWSELNFVMDPSLDRSVQIFAPRALTKAEALQVFIASVETTGLRVLHLQGALVKIVPLTLGKLGV